MEFVASIVMPVFGIVVLGFGAGKFGFFPQEALKGLSKFAFSFAIPLMLFGKMANLQLPGDISWELYLSYYGAVLGQWVVAVLIGKYLFRRADDENAILGMGAAFSNMVVLGTPVVLRAYGDEAALPLFMIIGVHATFQFTIATLLLERAQSDAVGLALLWKTLKGTLTNPIVAGLLAGITVNFAGLTLPKMINDMIAIMGGAGIPAAIFGMGVALAGYQLKGNLQVAVAMTALKLVWFPIMVYGLCTMIGVSDLWRAVAVLIAGMPSGVNAYLFATAYSAGEASSASGILLSTFLSIFSLGAILYLTAPAVLP